MTKPNRHLRLLTALILAASCRTTTETAPASGAKPQDVPVHGLALTVPVSPAPAPPSIPATTAPAECPVRHVACGQHLNPVICTAELYANKALAPEARIVAWGSNVCAGRLQLSKEACAGGLLPSKLGEVQCVPDSSGGNCPPAATECPGGGQPAVCVAGSYGAQKLGGEQRLTASAANECLATARLRRLACQQNLNPKLIGDIGCQPDPTRGECPPKPSICHDPPRRATCSAHKRASQELVQPLQAKGDTACDAKQDLARQACALGFPPSTLDEIVCIFGQ